MIFLIFRGSWQVARIMIYILANLLKDVMGHTYKTIG